MQASNKTIKNIESVPFLSGAISDNLLAKFCVVKFSTVIKRKMGENKRQDYLPIMKFNPGVWRLLKGGLVPFRNRVAIWGAQVLSTLLSIVKTRKILGFWEIMTSVQAVAKLAGKMVRYTENYSGFYLSGYQGTCCSRKLF